MSYKSIGKVSIVPKGEFSTSSVYDRLDVVTYEGEAYIAKTSCAASSVPDEEHWGKIINRVCPFPVGGIYMSVGIEVGENGKDHPSTIWPGTTWELISTGSFLVSAATPNSEEVNYAVTSSGGSDHATINFEDGYAKIGFYESVNNNVISADTSHLYFNRHSTEFTIAASDHLGNQFTGDSAAISAPDRSGSSIKGIALGGSSQISILPPYYAVYMWKRTH